MALIPGVTVLRRVVSMPRWSGLLGRSRAVTDVLADPRLASVTMPARDLREVALAKAIRAACRHLPYDPRCLDQATAGQLLLRLRRSPGIVFIGLDPEQGDGEKWGAHAWLIGRSGVITGGREARQFHAASCFVPEALQVATAADDWVYFNPPQRT